MRPGHSTERQAPLVSTADDAAAGAYPQNGAAGGFGAVTETPPAGSGGVSGGLDDGEVQAAGRQVNSPGRGTAPPRTSLTRPAGSAFTLSQAC